MSEKEYFCTLTPMGEYFLGGERTFAFGENDTGDAKKDYFIESENLPSQATVFGTLRFLILQKAGLLSNGHADESRREEQARLVGEDGFSVGRADAPYGKLYHLSPIFLLRGGKRYIRTPLNHKIPEKKENKEEKTAVTYCPFVMKPFSGLTDLEEGTLLPSDYVAKDGLFDGFLCLDGETHSVISNDDIFKGLEHTRIAKTQDDKAFVKKVYKHFNKEKDMPFFRIAFYCTAEENVLPEEGIVYLGQDKSTFHFTCVEASEKTGTEKTLQDAVAALPATADTSVFYALSDVYMDIDEETEKLFAFSVVQKRPFRTMETQRGADSFRGSRRKSALYQLVRAGSVFYVRPGKEDDFRRLTENAAMTRIGLNFVQQLGGK